MQPLSILFGAGFTVAVGYSCGALLPRKASADPATRVVAGSASLSALVFGAGALRLFHPAVFFKRVRRPELLFVPFAILYQHHLGPISRFVAHHGFTFTFGRSSAAAVVHAPAAQVFPRVRREGGEVAASLAENKIWFPNPVAPLFKRYFLNKYANYCISTEYKFLDSAWPMRTNLPLQLTGWGSRGGLFGPIFLPVPLAAARWRLLIPAALPFVASAMALVAERSADAIRLSGAGTDARPILELRDGGWQRIEKPEFGQVQPPDNLRLRAAEDPRRRGVFDDEFSSGDMRARAPEWGVAQSKGARLYKLR